MILFLNFLVSTNCVQSIKDEKKCNFFRRVIVLFKKELQVLRKYNII